MEDGEIVELFLRRDENAVARASEKYGKRLRDLAERITGDPQTALECENDTYLRAWNSIPPNEPRDCLFSFLARITRNLSINVLKSGKSQKRRLGKTGNRIKQRTDSRRSESSLYARVG